MKNHDEQIKDFDTIEAQMVESRPVEARLIGEAPQQAQEETDAHDKVTMDEILRRMDRVIEQGEHMMETIDRIAQIRPQPGSGGWDVGLGNMIEARESTNHKIMGLLIKMYDDIRPQDRRKNEAYPEIPETQPPLRTEKIHR